MARGSDEYDALYEQHHARITRLCRLLLRDDDDAQDVTQEVFLVLYREHRRGDRRVGWTPWLTRVAVNACHRRRRSRWWRVWHAADATLDGGELAVERTPEAHAIATDERRRVLAVFNRLSVRQQEVFVLRQVEGYSTDEVATMLGVRPGSVKRHLFRATHAFQRALRPAHDDR